MFAAKLVILHKDGWRVIFSNHDDKLLRLATVTTGTFHRHDSTDMLRVCIFAWDESNVDNIAAFRKFFNKFVAPEDYSFVMSIDDKDMVRDGGVLNGVAEIRKTIHLNGSLVAAKTEF